MGIHWRSCCSFWTKIIQTPTRRTRVGKAIWKSIDGTWLGKVPNWECSFVHRKLKLFLSVYVDDINMAGKKQNLALMWKKLMKNIDIEEPTTFLDHVYLGCTQRECKPNEKIIGRQQDVRVPYFFWRNRKITRTGQTALKNFSAVLWHGRTCSKMRGTVLRIGKQEDRATTQGFQSLFGRSPNWKGRVGK